MTTNSTFETIVVDLSRDEINETVRRRNRRITNRRGRRGGRVRVMMNRRGRRVRRVRVVVNRRNKMTMNRRNRRIVNKRESEETTINGSIAKILINIFLYYTWLFF